MSAQAELNYRPHTQEDLIFIMDSWGYSYYHGSCGSKSMSPCEFHSFHRPIRERILARTSLEIIVCCSNEDPWLIVGWIAFEKLNTNFILHYVYVKNAFQNQLIGKDLLTRAIPEKGIIAMTHLTYNAARIMGRSYPYFYRFKYVPHAV